MSWFKLSMSMSIEYEIDDCETIRQLLNALQLTPEPYIRDSEECKDAIANLKAEIDHLRTVIENQKHKINKLSTHNIIKKEVVDNLNKRISESKTKYNKDKIEWRKQIKEK